MEFDLSDEHEAFRKVVRDFAEAEIAPHAEAWDRGARLPDRRRAARWASWACSGCRSPRSTAAAAPTSRPCASRSRSSARVDQSMAITLEAGVGLGANPIYRFGTEEQKQQWLPDLCAGRALGALRPHRARGGQRRGRHAHQGRARRGDGRVGDRRREGVHHQLGHADHVDHHGHRPHRARPRSPPIVVPAGTPGLAVQPPYRKMGWHASDTHGLTFDGCRVPAEPPARRAGTGLRAVPRHPRRGTHRDRRARGRRDPGVPRAVDAVRQGPQRVRPADRRQPGQSRSGAPTWR